MGGVRRAAAEATGAGGLGVVVVDEAGVLRVVEAAKAMGGETTTAGDDSGTGDTTTELTAGDVAVEAEAEAEAAAAAAVGDVASAPNTAEAGLVIA